MPTRQQGFTLIELMIVIAIVGILTLIALPVYQDKTARAQVTEAFSLAEGQKIALIEYYSDKGTFPESNAAAGVATEKEIKGEYVESVKIEGNDTEGKIIATMKQDGVNKALQNGKLTLKIEIPKDKKADLGSFVWTCESDIDGKYLPSACRSKPAPADEGQ
ncbi:pilin [Neisseria sp. ZJ106]|uniref:Pilin n=1 Tax=Neisseria lisongii TaxID=2912188 RepID=A0ABY7RIW8_9NEIS|nr:pilin [Neisseria lisongii]MCF7520493.1 pilin [Neisseria lisongii]WCL71565.1 pilin [Neisseria lisongii]